MDGGYLTKEAVRAAAAEGVALYVPPKPPKDPDKNGDEFTPRPATASETVNADLRCRRGLRELTVRGVKKVTCVALWSALAYNVLHFAKELIG